MDVDAASPEGTPDGLGHVDVTPREDLRGGLQQGDRRSVVGQHGCELASDGSAPDDRDTVGNLGDGQQLVAGDHQGAVDLEARNGPRRGAGGQHHVVGRNHGRTIRPVDGYHVVDADAPRPAVDGDVAPRPQPPQALDQAGDPLLLAPLAICLVAGLASSFSSLAPSPAVLRQEEVGDLTVRTCVGSGLGSFGSG